MDLNKVMIIGNVTNDPELRTTPSGINVCNFSVATNYVYTNQQTGQKVEQVEFHNVVLWRKLGEIAKQYLTKGKKVFIEGRLQTRSWDGEDGKKRYKTEIIGDNMIMLSPAGGQSSTFAGKAPAINAKPEKTPTAPPLEELPTIQQDNLESVDVEGIPF